MEVRGRSRRRNVDGCAVVECYTPRRVVARWLFGLKSAKGKREEDEEGVEDDDETGPIKCSTKRLNVGFPSSPAPATNGFESRSRETSLDAGIGSFLLYLVVASKAELDKMAKLRMQMEMLLQNVKEELRKKELQEMPSKSSKDKTLYHSDECGKSQEPNDDNQITPQVISNLASSIFEESSTNVAHDESTESEVSKPEEYNGGTGRESKVEAELPSLNLNDKASERQMMMRQRQQEVKNTESGKSKMLNSEEVVADERHGVCPYELERRLHELLSARQQEEIQELETALRRVERRLDEKETEVSWWKDAANLLARRVPESSRAGLEYCIPESIRTTQLDRSSVHVHVHGSSSKAVLKRRVSWSR
ncbi:PREDICTED: protein POLAR LOCALIZATION DURING ASYMMETRIC DIVISION AND REDISTRIBUTION isoform X2 [Tarenaya hassleriana]|uniref:protein POLAR LOCALIZATION DURING ASYMMETRIC DIVISION AND REDISTRIBUTION isoform X2 n=1 Tax=Tarenaya hassleriana TaxID=28532 RepID=UPI00053C161C|nr:PREDICTED: protein POLAR LOCALIZATION DURING ASYMMETRIC DIVISION AND REDISTRIBUTION isoform X2 [Tarenaya hassleriana]